MPDGFIEKARWQRLQLRAIVAPIAALLVATLVLTCQVNRVIAIALVVLTGMGLAWANIRSLTLLSRLYQKAIDRSTMQTEHLAATLRSIGEAVITADAQEHVTFLNPVAERLTGWTQQEAEGVLLQNVFVIVNGTTREIVASPADTLLRDGAVIGLTNHAVLIGKNGAETPIDNMGAPIRDVHGNRVGFVLVFS